MAIALPSHTLSRSDVTAKGAQLTGRETEAQREEFVQWHQ